MKYQEKEQFEKLFQILEAKGCPISLASSFVKNNSEHLKNDILNHLYLVCNNQEIYAILIPSEDTYYWSICYKDNFYPLEKKTEQNSDYIIEMMLNFANTDKMKQIVPNIQEMNVETKVKVLKNISLNSTGYHFK